MDGLGLGPGFPLLLTRSPPLALGAFLPIARGWGGAVDGGTSGFDARVGRRLPARVQFGGGFGRAAAATIRSLKECVLCLVNNFWSSLGGGVGGWIVE